MFSSGKEGTEGNETIQSQQTEKFRRQQAQFVRMPGSAYGVDRNGFLLRRSAVYGTLQILPYYSRT